jgi:hypothetical protein
VSDSKVAYLSEREIYVCYCKGGEAAWKKVPSHFNPHPIGFPEWIIWKAGWDSAIERMIDSAKKSEIGTIRSEV